eukprot:scaffold12990_cov99-Isochrysis_galbana.AAC.5
MVSSKLRCAGPINGMGRREVVRGHARQRVRAPSLKFYSLATQRMRQKDLGSTWRRVRRHATAQPSAGTQRKLA